MWWKVILKTERQPAGLLLPETRADVCETGKFIDSMLDT